MRTLKLMPTNSDSGRGLTITGGLPCLGIVQPMIVLHIQRRFEKFLLQSGIELIGI